MRGKGCKLPFVSEMALSTPATCHGSGGTQASVRLPNRVLALVARSGAIRSPLARSLHILRRIGTTKARERIVSPKYPPPTRPASRSRRLAPRKSGAGSSRSLAQPRILRAPYFRHRPHKAPRRRIAGAPPERSLQTRLRFAPFPSGPTAPSRSFPPPRLFPDSLDAPSRPVRLPRRPWRCESAPVQWRKRRAFFLARTE